MQAFHNDPARKQKFLDRAIFHQNADHLVRGIGWESNGRIKGCAVWCLLEKYDHKAFEEEGLGPEWLGRLVDTLFEGMSEEKSRTWPEEYVRAIKPGSNLEKIKTPFLIFILESCLDSISKAVFDRGEFPEVEKAIDGSRSEILEIIRVIHCNDGSEEWEAWAALSARSAASAAEAVESAARSAAAAAEAVEPERSEAYDLYADKLLELLEAA